MQIYLRFLPDGKVEGLCYDCSLKPEIKFSEMRNKVLIRGYSKKDKAAVVDLLRLNTPQYFSSEEEKDLKNYLDHKIEEYFVVESDQKIIGCGGINFSDDRTEGVISWDILHPDFQRKGIGSLLLNYRLEKLKSLDYIKYITVRTSQLTDKFYEKQGFELIEVVKDYWAEGYDMYRMEYAKL